MTQGIVKSGMIANVKNMATSQVVVVANAGDIFYGDLSTGGTDLLNISHYYKGGTVLTQLGASCKVSVGNLTLSNTPEPSPSPTPTPTPTPTPSPVTPNIVHTVYITDEGLISIDNINGPFS